MDDQRGGRPPHSLVRAALTPREREVLEHVLRGATNKDIACCLGRSLKTIELHVSRVLRKLGQPTRIQLLVAMLSDEPHAKTFIRAVRHDSEKKSSA